MICGPDNSDIPFNQFLICMTKRWSQVISFFVFRAQSVFTKSKTNNNTVYYKGLNCTKN